MATPSAHAETPFHINFEQQKKRAKELRDALRRADDAAVDRFRRHHPKAAGLSPAHIVAALPRLSEAQLVIARELGLPSWSKLKSHAMALQAAGAAIRHGDAAPDGDMTTLHIRCGSDLRQTLADAGFAGDFLEYSNPFCQGPVIDGPDFLPMRADFLSRAYGLQSYEDTLADLRKEEDSLAAAAGAYDRVVLWFEHDSYDQLILARVLGLFADDGTPDTLEMIDLAHFPGAVRFIGLGQLPPEAIRMLWRDRKPVTRRQLSLGRDAWTAVRAPTPSALAEIAGSRATSLPNLPGALRRHLQELPSTANGLGLTEQLILEILDEGGKTAGQMFRALMRGKEPRPWLGDLMFWFILQSMGRVSTPVFTVTSPRDHPGTPDDPLAGPPDWTSARPPRDLAITDAGHAVLAGDIDWMSLGPPERWLGGTKIAPRQPCWRWDAEAERPVLV